MTVLRRVDIAYADSPSVDSFGRGRVGSPYVLLESKQIGGTGNGLFHTTAVTGSGATAYNINRSSTSLTVGPAVGTAIRQTKVRAIYQPGKSLRPLTTFIKAAAQAGLRQRAGYFDSNNGTFVEVENTTVNMVLRSFVTGAPVDTKIPQASWNLDKMNGAGGVDNPSGITLDMSKAQIFFADLEWLGEGRVRVGFNINGQVYYVHEFNTANVGTSVYMTNPNLPIRWEIEATAPIVGTATLECVCGSVDSEGGYQVTGVAVEASRGSTILAIPGGATAEILAVRMQSSFTEFATAFMKNISALAVSSGSFHWQLVLNPTEVGAGAWTPLHAESILEQNITRTITPGTGYPLGGGYVSADTDEVAQPEDPVITLGTTLAGVTDIMSLQITNLGSGPENFVGGMTCREVY